MALPMAAGARWHGEGAAAGGRLLENPGAD
jgi:hypothetical protein